MSVATIGIQVIMPKTGTPQQAQSAPQQQADSRDARASADASAGQKPAPPPPGMGKFVDRLV